MLSVLIRSKCSRCEVPPSGKTNFQSETKHPKLIYGTNGKSLLYGFSEFFAYELTKAFVHPIFCLYLLQIDEHMTAIWYQNSTPNNNIPLVLIKKAEAMTTPNNILSFVCDQNTRCSTMIWPMRHRAKGETNKNGMSDNIWFTNPINVGFAAKNET